jgi:hypothetical protein
MADGTSFFDWRAQQHQVYCRVVNSNGATARVGFPCPVLLNDRMCSLPSGFLQDAAKLMKFDTDKAKIENSKPAATASVPDASNIVTRE